MNIEVLREFYDLAQTRSFSSSAKNFYVTQSTMSKHIAALEKELGVTLFLRTSNGIELTLVGERFLPDVKRLLNDYDKALSRIKQPADGEGSKIRLGYLYCATKGFLNEALSAFRVKHQNVTVEFKAMEIEDIISALLKGKLDVAVTTGVFAFPERYASREIVPDEICVIAPAGHELCAYDRVRIDDLVSRDDVIFPYRGLDAPESSALRKLLGLEESMRSERKFHSNILTLETLLMCSSKAVITYGHVFEFMNQDGLQKISLKSEVPPFSVRVVWDRVRETPALLSLVDEISAAAL